MNSEPIFGLDLANGPDFTAYGDGTVVPNPIWTESKPKEATT